MNSLTPGNTNSDQGLALAAGAGLVVQTVAELREQLGSVNPYVVAVGYYSRRDKPESFYQYDQTDTASADNGGTVIVGNNGDRWKLVPNISISVCDFGVIGDGARDNAAALTKLRAWVAAKTASGNVVQVTWPAGRYVYSQGPNWAIPGLRMIAEGEVWLINTGTDTSFLCDGSYIAGGVRGMSIEGDFRVFPNAGSAIGVLIKSVHVSEIQIVSRGAGNGYSAIYISGCVCTLFKLRASGNDGGWYNPPTHCLYITQHEPGGQTSYCTFLNPVLEGAPIGVLLDGAMGNTFIGGTMEACPNIGAQLTLNAIQNKFFSIDFEENGNHDILCEGSNNEFISCDTLKKISIAAGSDNQVVAGLHQTIEVLAPASRTLLSGFKYNRTGGSAFPADAGTKTRFRDLTNVGTGLQHNAPPTLRQLTVGASPFTYTNTAGNDQSVAIVPGIITGVAIVRNGAALPLPATNGMYELSPGDAIRVEYTALPALFVLSR
ncbi:hypothetical protein RA224_14190 [Achromobacter aegrifaciens]|uniref:hypothetical protein n=1 Tax=Achromobacter aegrifaciens TaxID=1287736 RepID=UPI0027B8C5FA|nr:hypothetical protein [Achromobacter aegrifaciens]WLW64534.1 hypothetical protein RA224_14190 [Achromobacter aegrifaciens]